MGHGLFVLAAPGRQGVPVGMQRLAEAGDIAMAEDRPDAFDEAAAVLGRRCTESQRTMACAAVRRIVVMSSPPCARGLVPDARRGARNVSAIMATAASSVIWPCSQSRRRVAKDRAADGEALHQGVPRGKGKRGRKVGFAGIQAQDDDAARMRVVARDRGAGVVPGGVGG